MAKTLQHYRGYIIKSTTQRDNTTFSHWICTRENPTEPEFEVSSSEEAKVWIDGIVDADETIAANKAAGVAKRKAKAALNKAEKKLDKHCKIMDYTAFFPNEYTKNAVIYVTSKDGLKVRISCNLNTMKIKEEHQRNQIKGILGGGSYSGPFK